MALPKSMIRHKTKKILVTYVNLFKSSASAMNACILSFVGDIPMELEKMKQTDPSGC